MRFLRLSGYLLLLTATTIMVVGRYKNFEEANPVLERLLTGK